MHVNLSVQSLSYKGGGLGKKNNLFCFACQTVVGIIKRGVDYYVCISLTLPFINKLIRSEEKR